MRKNRNRNRGNSLWGKLEDYWDTDAKYCTNGQLHQNFVSGNDVCYYIAQAALPPDQSRIILSRSFTGKDCRIICKCTITIYKVKFKTTLHSLPFF